MADIRKFGTHYPQIDNSAFIDDSAVIIGQISIHKNASIWCNVVARGDVSHIEIGENTNIQDLTMLHVTHYNPGKSDEYPLIIGKNVTVGHKCCLHACTIKDNVLVGMGTTILDNSVIESNVIIGAGSMVTSNKTLESGYLYFGNPLKQIRPLTQEEIEHIAYSARHYVKLMNLYKESL